MNEQPKNICAVCGESTSDSMSLHKQKGRSFLYLEPGQQAHMECYIDLCVKISLEKYKILDIDRSRHE